MADGANPFTSNNTYSYIKRKMSQIATFFLFVYFFFYNTYMNITTISLQVIEVSPTEYPTFASRLKFAMALRNYSSQKLANHLYLTHSTISGYRNGTRMPAVNTLCDMAEILDVSVDFLLCRTNYTKIS
jgi:hypothetical protein